MAQDIEREKQIAEQAGAGAQTQESPLVAAFREAHPDGIREVINAFGETTIIVPREAIVEACRFYKTTPGLEFTMLADLCGVDRGPEEDPRFEVNYHLFSTTKFHRIRLKVLLPDEDPRVATVTTVWRTANWHERETWDMFGIRFEGHPDLRRILLPEDWQGHALRKDFPLRGFEPYSLT